MSISSHNSRIFHWFNIFLSLRPLRAIVVVYYLHITGSYSLATLLFTIGSVSSCLFEVPTGVLSDFLGRKKTVIVGTFLLFIAMLVYIGAQSFWALALGALFEALSVALFSGNNDALLYESMKQDGKEGQYSDVFGKIGATASTAAAFTALASGFIAKISLALVAITSAITVGLAFIISLFFIESTVHTHKIESNIFSHLVEALREFKKNAKLRDLTITSTLDWGLGGFANEFQPAFNALLWPVWAIGVARFIQNVAYAITGWFAGRLLKRVGKERWLLGTSFVRSAIGFISYGFPTVASPALLAVEEALVAPIHVAQNDLMQQEFTERQRATMASLNSLAGNLFFGLCSIVFGLLADAVGPARSLLLSEVALLPICFFYFRVWKQRRQTTV